MLTLRKTRLPRGRRICQVRVRLQGTRGPVWRRLQIPGDANLGWLHAVAQVAMGWTNSHLHAFYLGDQTISDSHFELDSFEDDPPVTDEKTVQVNNVLARRGAVVLYEYDFGDSWDHTIEAEDFSVSNDTGPGKAVCLDGAGACPPEDCGGPPGYKDLLRALKSPKHPEHKEMKAWLGRPFDPGEFSTENTNRFLAKLTWPRVTEAGLRRILMARDGV